MTFKKTLATIAAAATVIAAPVLADTRTQFVIDQLNMSADTSADLIATAPSGPVLGMTVSTNGDNALALAIDNFNASTDSVSDRIDLSTTTTFANEPAFGGDIFAEMRAADDDN